MPNVSLFIFAAMLIDC